MLFRSAALMIAGRAADYAAGAVLAAEAIDSGRAEALLKRWIDLAQ